jgi:uncharacterized membrane protein YbhN (UPF0104 family)
MAASGDGGDRGSWTVVWAVPGAGDERRVRAAPILREVLRAARRPTWRLVVDWVLTAAGIGIAVWRIAPTLTAVNDRGTTLAEVNWGWIALALVASVLSLAAYGELYRSMLWAGGARLDFRTVQTVNWIGNAVAQTVPSAGATAGVAYSVAAFRIRGVDTGLSLWTSVLAALLSGGVLVLAGPVVLAYHGIIPLPAGAALSGLFAVAMWVAWWLLRRPASLHWLARRTTAVARRLPVVRHAKWLKRDPGRAEAVSERIALLHPSAGRWAGFFGIAMVSWAFDYLTLVACVAAAADTVPWEAAAIGYLAVQASIGLQLTPAGAGAAEAALLAALSGGGLVPASAALAVVLFRVITWPLLAGAGWVIFLVTGWKRARQS